MSCVLRWLILCLTVLILQYSLATPHADASDQKSSSRSGESGQKAISKTQESGRESISSADEKVQSSLSRNIERVLNRQCDAWNSGKLDDFMSGYLDSVDTSYSSGGKEVWGYEALSKRYKDRYGASPETMGKLKFSELRTYELGGEHALCLGHWHLTRSGKQDVDGVFSLIFVRKNGDWKIIHDHTSVTETVPAS